MAYIDKKSLLVISDTVEIVADEGDDDDDDDDERSAAEC